MKRALIVLALALSPASAGAEETPEGRAIFDCYLAAAIQFEPHQDNMLDLAEILVESVCYEKRQAFLISTSMNNPKGIEAFRERMVREIRAMILHARATRLGIQYE